MTRNKRLETAAWVAGTLVLFAISTALAWYLRNAPDETSHATVVEHYAHHFGWMTWQEWRYGPQRGHGYNLFSPVPYIPYLPFQYLADRVSALQSASQPLFVPRLGGLTIAFAQLWLTVAIVRRMCIRCSRVAILAVAIAANLIPQLRYTHAYLNADALTILAATAAFALALRVLQQEELRLVDAILVGLSLALIAYVRYNAFLVGAILLVVFAFRVIRSSSPARTQLRFIGVAVALPLLLAGGFHLHVYNELQNGHVFATIDNEQLAKSTFDGKLATAPSVEVRIKHRVDEVPNVWMTTWSWYVSYVELRGIWLWLLLLGCLGGLGGLLWPTGRIFSPSGRWIGIVAVAAFFTNWILLASQRLSDVAGRFLLPAGVIALAAVILGCADVLSRVARPRRPVIAASATWAAFLLGINLWAVVRVAAA
jgi:hypothetical protein